MSQALIFPITAAAARAWAAGSITDIHLLDALAPDAPEAIFFCSLSDLHAWRSGIHQARYWIDRGARLAITRTGNQVLLDHYGRVGGLRTVQTREESSDQWRMIFEAEALDHYFRRRF